jgi:NADH:ubiquinone oxidoreductase subunit H
VQVTGAFSTRLREGDVLELRGESFPEGRVAEVTLRGEVARPGQPPSRAFRVSVPGRSVSTHAVAIDVTRPFARTFSGTTDPTHATFHGSIEVSFAPRVAGTPPVTGVLADTSLDFMTAEGDLASLEARGEDARKFAEFIGVLPSDSGSVTVAGVMPGSSAERAGVVAGDRFVSLGGVNVLGMTDLVPPPRTRHAELVVERGGSERRRLALDVAGFRPLSPHDLGLAGGLVLGALALLVLLASPFGRALSFVEHRLAERLRERARREEPRGSSAPRPPSWTARALGALPSGVASYVMFVAASGVLAALSLGIPLVARELDVLLLVVLSFTALGLTSLVFGAPGEQGLWARCRRALLVVAQAVPAVLSLGCVGGAAGSFGTDSLALAQGAAPWQWLAFRGPLLFGAATLLFLSLVPEASRGRSLETVLGQPVCRRELRQLGPALAGQAALLLGSGVLALAFLGGARVPGVELSFAPSFGVALGGVLIVLAKAWLVAGAVTGVRWALGGIDIDEVRALTLRIGVPVAAVLFGLSLLARRAPFEHLLAVSDRGLAWACLVGWVVLALALARRVAPRRVALEGERGPNPWL